MRKLISNKWLQMLFLTALSVMLLLLPKMVGFIEEGAASLWVDFIGSYHPLALHLPIGIFAILVVLEMANAINKKWEFPRMLILVVLSISSVGAAVLGFIWYLTGDWKGESMAEHLDKGLWFAAFMPWIVWIYYYSKKWKLVLYRLSLLVGLWLMYATSHEGGAIVHGDPMDRAPWKEENQAKLKKKVVQVDRDNSAVKGMLVYEDLVVPILKAKCYTCHNEKKQKGALRLDTIDFMLEGGDNDIALEKGDAKASPLISTILLPITHNEHMPPEDEPQVTEIELAILTWWVNSGAEPGKKLSDYPDGDALVDQVVKYLNEAK